MDKYYKTREGKLYTDYTRQEILDSIDINDFNTWLIWLKRILHPNMSMINYVRLCYKKMGQLVKDYLVNTQLICAYVLFAK